MSCSVILSVAKNLFLLLLPTVLSAQGAGDRARLLLNRNDALWLGSDNAAGLAFSAPAPFNIVDVGYSYGTGDHRLMQTGTSVGVLDFDTQGALRVGKVQLWGRFRYDNTSDRGSSFNTLLYDPYDERFMYTAADTVAGHWKKQSYLMQFKAALPLGEHLSAGVYVDYNDRIVAGQIDPRAESYNYSVTVRPGMTWHSGIGTFGLNGLYSNTFERSTPSISNSQQTQNVYLLRGLGNWVGEQVGGGGLSTVYYRCNSWGGGLQYSYEAGWKLMADLGYKLHTTDIHESATQPKPHGDTRRQEAHAGITALFGDRLLHKLDLSADAAQTIGVEPTVQWNKDTGTWDVTYSVEQCKLLTAKADLTYEAFILNGDTYNWHFSAAAGLDCKRDTYALPASVFTYTNASVKLGGEYNHDFTGGSALLVGATVSMVRNLDGKYEYNGHRTGTAPVRDLYPHNFSILSADRIGTRLAAEFAFPVGKGTKLAFCAEGGFLFASCTDSSSPASITVRNRAEALGAVKLYF